MCFVFFLYVNEKEWKKFIQKKKKKKNKKMKRIPGIIIICQFMYVKVCLRRKI